VLPASKQGTLRSPQSTLQLSRGSLAGKKGMRDTRSPRTEFHQVQLTPVGVHLGSAVWAHLTTVLGARQISAVGQVAQSWRPVARARKKAEALGDAPEAIQSNEPDDHHWLCITSEYHTVSSTGCSGREKHHKCAGLGLMLVHIGLV